MTDTVIKTEYYSNAQCTVRDYQASNDTTTVLPQTVELTST
jgi:hypothetical protein